MRVAEVPESQGPNIRGRSYNILAEVELHAPDASGVLTAGGARFGGHALFIKDGKAFYVYNFLGITEQQFVSTEPLGTGKHLVGAAFTKEGRNTTGEFTGTLRLHVDDQVVAEGPMVTQPGFFSLCGEGLCVGRESADAVSKRSTSRRSRSPAARSLKSSSTSAASRTPTWREKHRLRSRATDPNDRIDHSREGARKLLAKALGLSIPCLTRLHRVAHVLGR
jgi:hypothetical protein